MPVLNDLLYWTYVTLNSDYSACTDVDLGKDGLFPSYPFRLSIDWLTSACKIGQTKIFAPLFDFGIRPYALYGFRSAIRKQINAQSTYRGDVAPIDLPNPPVR